MTPPVTPHAAPPGRNLLVELLVEELPPKALKKLGEALGDRKSTRLNSSHSS